MGDDGRQLLLIVGHHHHRLVTSLTEGLDDVLHTTAVLEVESVQGLVEYQQLRVLDEGTRQ